MIPVRSETEPEDEDTTPVAAATSRHGLTHIGRRLVALAASPVGFGVAVVLTVVRQLFSPLLLDFRNGLYYPTRAFLAGVDPYTDVYLATYPVGSPFPYPPHALLTFLPFALPPYPIAAGLYFVFGIASMLGIAILSLRLAGIRDRGPWLWGVATAVLLSRPGHMAVVQGQPTLLVLGAALFVIGVPGRPWASSVALAITTIKPTFGAPLILLTMARGYWALAFRAIAIAVGLALYPTIALARRAGGLLPWLTSVWENHHRWLTSTDNDPSTSVYRVDAPALLGHVLGHPLQPSVELVVSATVIAAAALTLWHRRRDRSRAADHVTTSLVVTAVLTSVYHQTYDLILLAPVAVALAAREDCPAPGRSVLRWTLLGMLAVSAGNYLATHAAISALGFGSGVILVVSSWNAVVMLTLFLTYLTLAGAPSISEPETYASPSERVNVR